MLHQQLLLITTFLAGTDCVACLAPYLDRLYAHRRQNARPAAQAEDARAYNEHITSWTGIESAAAATPKPAEQELPTTRRVSS